MEVNPQIVIEELSRRLQQAVLENVVLAAQIRQLQSVAPVDDEEETTVIG